VQAVLVHRVGLVDKRPWLINHGAELDAANQFGDSALSLAVYYGYPDVVRKLLEGNPDVNRVDNDGSSILRHAFRHPDILSQLLDAGADIEATDKEGKRLTHHAIINGHEDIMGMILDREADVNAPDAGGRPPIYYAVQTGKIDLVRLLAGRGATLSGLTETASLLHAAIRSSPDMLRAILEFRKFLDLEIRDSGDETPLLAARSNIDCWRLMINAGADLHATAINKFTPLRFAVEPGMAEFRSALLSQPDIDVERGGIIGPPLYWACRWLDIDAVRDLIASGASVHPKPAFPTLHQVTPLVAALHGDWEQEGKGDLVEARSELIRLLISHGCDVREEIKGSLVHGALSLACLISAPELVTLLLNEGVLADESSPFGSRYPLHYAATNGIGTFKLIHDAYDGDMMVQDDGRKHCLHWAAQSGNAQTIRFILEHLHSQNRRISEYVNTLDIDGWSPLCWAIRPFNDSRTLQSAKTETSNFEGTVRILLDNGADPAIKCPLVNRAREEMVSVLELARRRGAESALIDMLRSALPLGDQSSPGPAKDESPNAAGVWLWCNVCFAVCLPVLSAAQRSRYMHGLTF
jgi:ankyrin repeat protein